MAYDGEVRIKTKVDTSQMQRLQVQIDKAALKVENLSKKYEQLKNQKIHTDGYSALENKLKSAQVELTKLIAEEEKLSAAGLSIGAPWDNIIAKEADAQLKIEAIQAEMQKLVETGRAFTVGGNKDEISKAADELGIAKAELRALVTKQDELNAKTGKLTKKTYEASNGLKRIGEVGKKAFSGLHRNVNKSNGLFRTFGSRLRGILLSLLVFNWITKGFNAMVSGLKEGYKNLVKYSDEYNRSMSALQSASTQMKNSLATAFAPIVQAAIPYLITLINYVTAAANAVSQFFAVLSGKSTWIKAIAVQENYAGSLNGTAAAAKKAAGALASFDTLEVLNKQDTSGGSGGAGAGLEDMFEEVPVENNSFTDFANNLKDWLEKLKEAAEPTIEAFKRLWDEGLAKLKDFAFDTLLDFYNDFLVPVGSWMLGEGLPRFLNITNDLLNEINWDRLRESLDRFYQALAVLAILAFDALLDFYEYFLKPLAVWTMSEAIPQLLDIFSDFVERVDWEALNKSLEEFWKALEPYAENFGQGLINFFADLKEIGIDFMNKMPGVIDGITEALNNGDPEKAQDWGYTLGQIAIAILAIKAAVAGFTVAKGLYEFFQKIKEFGTWISGTWIFTKLLELGTAIAQLGPLIAQGLSYLNPGMLGEAYLAYERFSKGTFLDPEQWKGLPAIFNDALTWVANEVGQLIRDFVIAIGDILINAFTFDWSFSEDGFFAKAEECFYKLGIAFENQDWGEIGFNIVEGILNGIAGALGLIGEVALNLLTSFWDSICEVFGINSPAISMYPIGEYILLGIIEGFKSMCGMFTQVITDWYNNDVKPWFTLEKWAELGQGILDGISLKWQEFVTWWGETALVQWWEEKVVPWFSVDKWLELAANIYNGISQTWEELVTWWDTNIVAWWDNSVAPWFTVEKWKALGEAMKKGIYNGFAGIVNKIVDVLNNAITSIENFVNAIIDKINELIDKIKASMGVFAPPISHIGSISFGRVPKVEIPALANGAVLRGGNPFLAILGDQRAGQTNIEAPQSAIEDAVAAGMSRAGAYGGGTIEINLNYDGETFARLSLKDILSEMNRQGYDIDVLGGMA